MKGNKKDWREEVTPLREWFTIAALLSLLLSIGLADKIRTFHVPEMGDVIEKADEQASYVSDWLVFGLEKWIVRLKGGTPTADFAAWREAGEEAEEEAAIATGLPINDYCDPLGSSEVVEFIELVHAVQGMKNANSISAHCTDSRGREIIQVRDNEGSLPVYTIARDETGAIKEFIKL